MPPSLHGRRLAVNPEQQRIAIAEACGWKLVTDNPEYEPYWEDPKGNMVAVSNGVHRFPNYLNDLNAMHEAETFIRNAQDQMRYASETLIAMGFDDLIEASDLNVDYCWHAMGATAAQRAEAFLKALNLWKP